MLNKLKKNESGQSLVENTLALVVVIVAIVGIVSLVVRTLTVSGVSRSEAEVLRLATERIEVLRKYRDTNVWENFISGCYSVVGGEAIKLVGSLPCSYSQIQGNTKYSESITVSDIGSDTKKVTVSVSYTQDLNQNSIELVSYLTNWRVR